MGARRRYRPGGRPVTDRRVYWSDDHGYLLLFCAKRASEQLRRMGLPPVSLDELMSQGYWRCLRRCRPGDLHGMATNTICSMLAWAVRFYGPQQRKMVSLDAIASEDPDPDRDGLMAVLSRDDAGPAAVDAKDLCRRLRDRVERDLWALAFSILGKGETVPHAAERLGVSGSLIRLRLKKFLAAAKAVLREEGVP